jgi:hypothetical protein
MGWTEYEALFWAVEMRHTFTLLVGNHKMTRRLRKEYNVVIGLIKCKLIYLIPKSCRVANSSELGNELFCFRIDTRFVAEKKCLDYEYQFGGINDRGRLEF